MEKIIMKKLVLSLLLSAVAVNAFGMENSDVQILKSITYPIAAVVAIGWGGYYASWAWTDYMQMRKKCHEASLVAKVPVVSQPSSWVPYAKIAAGLGLTGLTAYLGCKQTHQPQSMVNTITNEPAGTSSGGTSLGNTLSPSVMISFASAYTLAPMVPAYFLFKSGFEDLKAERDLAYHKEYAKTVMGQAPADQPKPTYV